MILTVTNLKGGTGKTTSAMYLACLAAETVTVVLVDADPQGSAALWAEATGPLDRCEDLPFPVVGVASTQVGRAARDLADRYDLVIIDTAPGHLQIALSALHVSDVALVPVTTGSVDLPRWSATVELVEAVRDTNPALKAATFLTKTRAGTVSQRDVRQALDADGRLPVLQTEIPLREAIAGAEGTVPTAGEDLELYRTMWNELADLTWPTSAGFLAVGAP